VKQCRYRHCRRFIRRSTRYCSGLRMCQLIQEDRDAMSEGMIRAIQEVMQRRQL
jgi:hypothetical protein